MKEVHVSNVPYAVTERDLKTFLESVTRPGAVCSCELRRDSFQSSHKGYGFVVFADEAVAEQVRFLAANAPFLMRLQGRSLRINVSKRQVKHNPDHSVMGLSGNCLSMGCLTGDTFHILWSTNEIVESEFDFRERKLDLKINVDRQVDNCGIEYVRTTSFKLEFRFRNIYSISKSKTAGSSSKGPLLLIELWYPPSIFKEGQPDLSEMLFQLHLFTNPKQPWCRTVDFTANRSIGQCFAYLLEFPRSIPETDLSKVLSCLEDYRLVSADSRLLQLKKDEPYADMSPDVLVPLVKCPPQFCLTFKLMFTLNHLVQVGNLSGPSLDLRFFELLYRTPEEAALWVLQSLEASTTMVTVNPEQWLRNELNKIRTGGIRLPTSTSIQLDDGLIWVYRVTVSPTKIYCIGREPEVSNRVTREYIDVIDNFIRVSFAEEDHLNLGSQALSDSGNRTGQSDVYMRIQKVLKEGIWLQGKHFEFLAFSSSQLREHSVWMFAQAENVSADRIRKWMGNFLSVRNVAKCAARMGQCFSSTTKTFPVERWEVEYIPDIETADGKYCFSDGIGKISSSFARRVAAKLGCHGHDVPSAFQIRYGGYKGVVAVSHESLEKLSLRNSMKKFDSEHFDLEVIGWSKRLPCYLNRQIITLLSSLGIKDDVFEEMQKLLLLKLNEIVVDISVALETLQMTSSGATHQTASAMLKAGYHPTREPYLLSLLQAFRASQLLQLRTKSRILVPKGRTMMGCLDEIGVLEYGEVFLRVSSFPGTRSFINDGLQYEDDGKCVVRGRVVVAKNPCLHPGDVRVLEAVDIPELHHMVDCVVFPQRGSRPHPNECSGSDLDGDLYFVSWDQLLVPFQTDEPMSYDPPEIISLARPVNIEDIQNFFVEYMKSDALGIIANAHVVHADREPAMARDPKCVLLAELFAVAVDFPKTGKPAVMHPDLRPRTYPDFMEKDEKITYISERVIGKLFRTVVGQAKDKTLISTFTRDRIVRSFDSDLIWHGFEVYIEEAKMFKSWYDAKLVGLMNQYGIKTEAEALSGNILPLSKFYAKGQNDVRERISFAVRSLQSEARSWFKHGYGDESGVQSASAIEPGLEEYNAFAKASAWYHVTYHERYLARPSGVEEDLYLLSFPWVVHETILNLKKRNRRVRH